MKKIISVLLVALAIILSSFAGCINTDGVAAKNGDTVVLTVESTVADGTTLADYMSTIKGGEALTSFTFEGGMLTEINNMKASGSTYWMLYTDDAEFSNADWGVVVVDEVTYYSATLGAESLVVKGGCTYIWQAQTF